MREKQSEEQVLQVIIKYDLKSPAMATFINIKYEHSKLSN